MMKQSKRTLALFTVLALLIAAFGSAMASSTIGGALQYDLSADVNGGEALELEFWYPEDVKAIVEKYAALYTEAHPNITFVFNSSPWDDYWTKLPMSISGGQGPDIFWMHNAYTDQMMGLMAAMPEDIFPMEALKADFRQVAEHLIDGKLYYIDTGLMSSIIMYNKAMWKDAGLSETELPKTWDEVLTAAKAMTKADAAGNIEVSGFSFNGDNGFANLVQAMNYQKGHFTFSADGTTSLYNDPVTIEHMEYLRSWYTDAKVGDHKGSVTYEAIASGKTAMICDWTWIPGFVAADFPEIELGFFPTPAFGETPAAYDRNNGECSPVVSDKSSDAEKAAAFDFVKWLLAGDDFIKEFSLAQGIFPSKFSLNDDPDIQANPLHQVLAQTIDRTIWVGPLPSQIESIVARYLQEDFLNNGVSAADAVKKTDELIAQELASGDLNFVPSERAYVGAADFVN